MSGSPARRAHARDAASLRAVVGLPGDGLLRPQATLGDPDDLRAFVDAMHANGIGVLLDWVPARFRDEWALARFDGTALYEHADPPRERIGLGHARLQLRSARGAELPLANALYWLEEFHADGLQVDAVASMLYLDYSREPGEWLPNPLWRSRGPRGGLVPP